MREPDHEGSNNDQNHSRLGDLGGRLYVTVYLVGSWIAFLLLIAFGSGSRWWLFLSLYLLASIGAAVWWKRKVTVDKD